MQGFEEGCEAEGRQKMTEGMLLLKLRRVKNGAWEWERVFNLALETRHPHHRPDIRNGSWEGNGIGPVWWLMSLSLGKAPNRMFVLLEEDTLVSHPIFLSSLIPSHQFLLVGLAEVYR